jgi:hypothetical protein
VSTEDFSCAVATRVGAVEKSAADAATAASKLIVRLLWMPPVSGLVRESRIDPIVIGTAMTTRCLNSDYFDLIETRVVGALAFQSYRVLQPTIILFNPREPLVPIAGVSFHSRVPGAAKTVIAPCTPPAALAADGAEMCRALTNVDNGEVAFGIHNLTDLVDQPDLDFARAENLARAGVVKIDIMTRRAHVDWVDDPTIGINQVNELSPSQSEIVKSDQQTGNHTIVLRGVVDTDNQNKAVSVAAEESSDTLRGTYYWINVVANSRFPELVALCNGATWRCVDFFTRCLPVNHCARRPTFLFGGPRELEMSHSTFVEPRARSVPVTFSFGIAQPCSTTTAHTSGAAQPQSARSIPSARVIPFSFGAEVRQSDVAQQQRSVLSDTQRHHPYSNNSASMPINSQPTRKEMASAQVANIVSGDTTIEVNSRATHVVYAFDKPAKQLCMGLAVWRDLRVIPDELAHFQIKAVSKILLDEAVSGENTRLLKQISTRFVEEKCVVCLEQSSSVVFYACGHQCTCDACAVQLGEQPKCCMCRSLVTAMVPATV